MKKKKNRVLLEQCVTIVPHSRMHTPIANTAGKKQRDLHVEHSEDGSNHAEKCWVRLEQDT